MVLKRCDRLWMVLVVMALLSVSSVVDAEGATPVRPVLIYGLNGTIHGGTVEIIDKLFAEAERQRAQAILIELDTPGGLLDATEDIVKRLLNSTAPTIVYVAPRGARAGSAGTFITLAAHIAAMAPGTYIGAAHPVILPGIEGKEKTSMDKKVESAMLSFIEAIAKERNRNVEWAKRAVRESESITADKALDNGVIDLIAEDRNALFQSVDKRIVMSLGQQRQLHTVGAPTIVYQPSLKLRFLNAIASPEVIYFLILIAIAGLYLELSHPGLILPGVVAGICLVLVLIATRTLPVNTLGILLIISSVGLLVAEIFVTSYGILTLTALAAFFIGSLLLFTPATTGIQLPLSYIIGSSAALAAIAVSVGYAIIRGSRRQQQTGKENLLGKIGIVEEGIVPHGIGKIDLDGEYWNATSAYTIPQGTPVQVTKITGLLLTVIPSTPS